jgi:flagellar transcriptional activator FlhC
MAHRMRMVVGRKAPDSRRPELTVKSGKPVPVLKSASRMTRQRLSRLYWDIHKKALPAELLAVPTDWFMDWQSNTHATAFLNVYEYLVNAGELEGQDVLVWSYRLYLEQLRVLDLPKVLSLAHAWRLVQYVDSGMLMLEPCNHCQKSFVVYTTELHAHFVCLHCKTTSCMGSPGDAVARGSAMHLS